MTELFLPMVDLKGDTGLATDDSGCLKIEIEKNRMTWIGFGWVG